MSTEQPQRSPTDRDGWSCRQRGYLKANAAAVAQAIADTPAPSDDAESWLMRDIDLEEGTRHGLVESLKRMGAIEMVDREYPTRDGGEDGGQTIRNRYAWVDVAYDDITDYLDEVVTFPDCPHRVHIHNPRGSDPEMLGCKECGQRYPKAVVRELL